MQLLRVLDQPPQGLGARPDPLDRGDLLLEREDRLDLERRAEPRGRGADAAAAAQVLERVDREPHLESGPCLAYPRNDVLRGRAGGGKPGPREGDQPHAAGRALGVDDGDPVHAFSLGELLLGLPGALDRPRDSTRYVDRDHVEALVHERPYTSMKSPIEGWEVVGSRSVVRRRS